MVFTAIWHDPIILVLQANRLSRRKDGKTIVMFDQQVDNLIRENPDEFYASLRKVVSPIWKAIFEKSNNFGGNFEPLYQSESVPKSLLRLTSSLIDGSYDSNEYI